MTAADAPGQLAGVDEHPSTTVGEIEAALEAICNATPAARGAYGKSSAAGARQPG